MIGQTTQPIGEARDYIWLRPQVKTQKRIAHMLRMRYWGGPVQFKK